MELKLNLASKPYLNRQSIRLWLMLISIFLLLLLLLNCLYGYQNYRQLGFLEERFRELATQASSVQALPEGYSPESYDLLRKKIDVIKEIVTADQFHWTALLNKLETLIPANVSIRTIQPDFNERSVTLECVARDVSAMTQFVDNLLASSDLYQAYLQRHSENENDADGGKQLQVVFSLVIREAF